MKNPLLIPGVLACHRAHGRARREKTTPRVCYAPPRIEYFPRRQRRPPPAATASHRPGQRPAPRDNPHPGSGLVAAASPPETFFLFPLSRLPGVTPGATSPPHRRSLLAPLRSPLARSRRLRPCCSERTANGSLQRAKKRASAGSRCSRRVRKEFSPGPRQADRCEARLRRISSRPPSIGARLIAATGLGTTTATSCTESLVKARSFREPALIQSPAS